VSLSVVKRFKPWRKTKPEWVQIDKDKDGCGASVHPEGSHEVGIINIEKRRGL
jgi:hypothetical protein